MSSKEFPLGFNEEVYLGDLLQEAREARKTFGRTDLYSTGDADFDEWLGQGFGKSGAFEIVVVLGEPGIGKSTLAMQMLAHSVEQGVEQAWAIMEDDHGEATERFIHLFPSIQKGESAVENSKIHMMPQTFMDQDYTLENVAEWFERKAELGAKLFLLDNLQFCFDDASIESNGKAIEEHRRFMKRLALIAKERKLTMILVSHTNKNPAAKGMNRILGSSAIQQVATKVIEIYRPDNNLSGNVLLSIHKNRYAEIKDKTINATRDGYKFVIGSARL